jgi:hypothetical protein
MNRSSGLGLLEIDDVELVHFQGSLFLRPPLSVGALKPVQEFCSTPTAAESLLLQRFSGCRDCVELIAEQRKIQMADVTCLWHFVQRLKSREKHTWFHDAPRKNSSAELAPMLASCSAVSFAEWRNTALLHLLSQLQTVITVSLVCDQAHTYEGEEDKDFLPLTGGEVLVNGLR